MMKDLLEGLIIAFAMYSKIPCPRVDWNEKNMRYCICFFPLIGVVIGALVWLWDLLAGRLGVNNLLRSALLVVIPVAVTGGIHLDGLLDTADALSSYKSREEKLEILKDSHAGAFAVIVGICYFVLQIGVLSEARGTDFLPIGLGFVLSRAYSGLALAVFPKAKGSGLLRTFADAAVSRRVASVMLVYIGVVSAALIWTGHLKGALQAVLALLVFAWYYRMSRKKFGGITGDLEGFFLQICELVMQAGVVLVR